MLKAYRNGKMLKTFAPNLCIRMHMHAILVKNKALKITVTCTF